MYMKELSDIETKRQKKIAAAFKDFHESCIVIPEFYKCLHDNKFRTYRDMFEFFGVDTAAFQKLCERKR